MPGNGADIHEASGDYDPADSSRTVQRGAQILLTTKNGTLVYLVQSVQKVAKASVDQGKVDALMKPVPGRLVLMTCAWYRGVIPAAGENVIVVAQFSSGR